MTSSSATLAAFAADLRYEDIPSLVTERAKELFLDWVGSALAGKNARPILAIQSLAQTMGPAGGGSELLTTRERTSPMFQRSLYDHARH